MTSTSLNSKILRSMDADVLKKKSTKPICLNFTQISNSNQRQRPHQLCRDTEELWHFIFVPNIHWVETIHLQTKIKGCTGYWGSAYARQTRDFSCDFHMERHLSCPANFGSTWEATGPHFPSLLCSPRLALLANHVSSKWMQMTSVCCA